MLPASPPGSDDQDLANWLREAGDIFAASYLSHMLAGLGAIAYLGYYYAGVMLQIYALPRVIVFILVDGLPPPI